MKSPGRKAMAKSLKGKPAKRPRWSMKNVPEAIECDLPFYRLFCESKELEQKTDHLSRARWETVMGLMRKRWAEVMAKPFESPNAPGSPVHRLLGLLKKETTS